MKLKTLCLTAVLSLQCFAAMAATGNVVVVLKDGANFRAEFTNAGTVAKIVCDGEELVCDNAYRFYTSEGTVGASGLVTDNLLLDTTPAHWVPSVKTGISTSAPLTQTSTESGVPVYDVALQVPALAADEKINIFFDNKPANYIPAAGVQSIWTYERGGEGCRLCVKRKVYNATHIRKKGAHSFLLFSLKEFLKPCNDGTFTTTEFEAVYTRETLTSLCHIFATPDGAFGVNAPVLGHVGAPDFLGEWNSPALTPGFSTGAGVGNRWLENFQKLGEFGLLLQPVGCKCTSYAVGWCWLLQCELLPPGGGDCPPCCCECPCCPGEEPPGTPTFCPKSKGFWKNNPTEWTVEAIVLGDEAYTRAEALAILGTPVGGDASLILAHQLIAAKLNIAAGADATPVVGIIASADALLTPQAGDLPYGTAPASASGVQMVLVAGILESYNKGLLTDCEEE